MGFMHFPLTHSVLLVACVWFSCGQSFSQTLVKPPVKPSVDLSKIEPGLDVAVNWKWWVVPPEKKDWGMPLPEAAKPTGTPGAPDTPASVVERPETCEVKKGDTLSRIARKFDMTAAQLQQFNKLKDDRITIGLVLRIPTPAEVLTMAPPPPEPKNETATKKKSDKSVKPMEPELFLDPGDETQLELEQVRLQVFLDREMFSPGVIDGKSGAKFLKICEIYQRTHPDAADPASLKSKAEAAMKEPYTRYTLRADDFKFIKALPKKPVPTQSGKSAKKKTSKSAAPTKPPPITIDELVAADFLSYETTWEFVAERFHCDEALLRRVNPLIKGTPVVGTEFKVPNVIPFEIEKALDAPLQPVADPQKSVTAAVVLLNRLEISCDGKLIAVMPLTTARPALRGRGSWIVQDAIAQPRLATKREPRDPPKENPATPEGEVAAVNPVIDPPLEKEQYLAPGPNNPVGIIWINLSKFGSTDPLPYGLHGTSIPSKMSLQGIGGLRLTNWDIARAVRLIPAGTALQWKAK